MVPGPYVGRFAVGVASRISPPNVHGTFWSRGRNNVAEISLVEDVERHSWFFEFRSGALCLEAVVQAHPHKF